MVKEHESGEETPLERPDEKQSTYDELAEHLKGIKGPERDIAMMLALNWQRVLGGLVLLLLIVWLVGEGLEHSKKREGEAAQYFSEAQRAYAAMSSSLAEESEGDEAGLDEREAEKSLTSFKDNLELLEDNFEGSIYGELAGVYQAMESLQQKDISQAKKALARFKVEQGLSTKNEELTPESFSRELAALLYARVMLLDPSQDETQLKKYLTGVVENAAFVNLEALVLLLRMSNSPEDKQELLTEARKLAQARPELGEAISGELSSAGMSFEF